MWEDSRWQRELVSIVQSDCARTLKMQVEERMEFIKPVGKQ